MSQYNTISGNKSLIKAKKNKEYFERILNFYRCKKGNGSLTMLSKKSPTSKVGDELRPS